MAKSLSRLRSVLKRVGDSRSGWYKKVQEGRAPKPIKVGRTSLWVDDEIDAYIERIIEEGRQGGEK